MRKSLYAFIPLIIVAALFLFHDKISLGEASLPAIKPQWLVPVRVTPAEPPPGAIDHVIVQQTHTQMAANSREFSMSGETTAGTVLAIAGKPVQLPPDVYVEAFVVTALCVEGLVCPETPYYFLRYQNTDDVISIGEKSGKMVDDGRPQAEQEQSRAKFSWLWAALE
ncbi:MAG: hypothetical protein KF832_12350 [Caldilineaceae bacterium]|nr:hypothetical protein [Caldilineaceae bacterium]